MLQRIDHFLAKYARVLLLGDVMLDRYVLGQAERISPEAPVPVLKVRERWSVPGGAGNVAMNLAGLATDVSLLAVVGEDSAALELESLLQRAGVTLQLFKAPRPTTTKTRLLSHHQQMIRLDEEDASAFEPELQTRLLRAIESLDFSSFGAIVLSDYAKGLCSATFCRSVIEKARGVGSPVVVDPKGRDWQRYRGASLVTPNLKELSLLAGHELPNEGDAIVEAARPLLVEYALGALLVTRSEKGMSLVTPEGELHIPTTAQEVCDVSGAGDTVVACTASLLAAGCPLQDAVTVANEAAACVVRHAGTSPIEEKELRAQLVARYGDDGRTFDTVVPFDRAGDLAATLRRAGKRIIFTNGCFDLLHRGHLHYLRQARALGDVLVVGLNSDASVRRLKGSERPINDEGSRSLMLASLEFVDHVILFEEDTPTELLAKIRPDVLVKGGDNRVEAIPGREHAGETVVMPFVDGYSSTNIIARVRSQATTQSTSPKRAA